MNRKEDISVLILSNYMICPPISGGAKRILFPAMNFNSEDKVRFTFMYLSYSDGETYHNRKYLESLPLVDKAIGIQTTAEKQFNGANMPEKLSSQVWWTINRDFLNAVIAELKKTHYDIVQVIHSQFAWLIPYIKTYSNAKVALDCQNLEWLVYKRWIPYASVEQVEKVRSDYITLKHWEEKVLNWCDYIFCISPIEAEIVQKMAQNAKVMYMPSGASINDDDYYPNSPWGEKKMDLLFIGSMNWLPNSHALQWFLKEVFPKIIKERPETKLDIVGSGTPDREMMKYFKEYSSITFWGQIEDEKLFLHGSKVFVSPIWIGAGVRLKNPTAWASMLPVVATTLSVEGLEYTDGSDLLIGDSPDTFFKHTLNLLESEPLRRRISEHAYSTYKKHYSMERLVGIWKQAYEDIAGCGD